MDAHGFVDIGCRRPNQSRVHSILITVYQQVSLCKLPEADTIRRGLFSSMTDVEGLDDDRDTSLPPSALSPAEYRGFRSLVNDLDHTGENNEVSLYSVLEFLASFTGVTHPVAQKVCLRDRKMIT